MKFYFLSGKRVYSRFQLPKLSPVEYSLACKVDVIIGDWHQGKPNYSLLTSGSTGKPREISFNRQQLIQSARITGLAFNLDKGDSMLVSLSIEHIAGFMSVIRALVLDMDLYVVSPVKNPFNQIPDDLEFSFVPFVPMQLIEVLKDKGNLARLNKMKAILVGGTDIPGELQEKTRQLKVPVYHTFGMTETLTHVAIRQINAKENKDYYTALPETSFGIDERKCLVVYSPLYNYEPLVTNDVVELLDDKKFRWLGRYDFVINSGGFKIHPEVIEVKLRELLPERNFFVWKTKDEVLGDKAVLVVEGEKIDIEKEKMHQVLHPYEVPKEFIWIERFKYLPSGKVDRNGSVNREY